MKKFLFLAVIALMTVVNVMAAPKGKLLVYTSSTTGITFHVPANAVVAQDDVEAVILQTPDEEYTFVAEAVNLNDVTSDDIARHIVKMAKAARIDLDKSDRIKHETEFVILKGEAIDYENGGAAAVGVAVVNDTMLGYYITVVASPNYVDFAVSSLTSIDFDPDAVQ